MEYFDLTNIGLILDIIGAILLYKYGLPSTITRNQPTLLVRNYTKKETRQMIVCILLSHVGIIFLISGFVLQFIGNVKT